MFHLNADMFPVKKTSTNIDRASWQDHGSPHVLIFFVVAVEIKGNFSACSSI
jgi:hypothetical protein